jgi:hypothetical protein
MQSTLKTISEIYANVNIKELEKLVELTTQKKCQFIAIKGYNSDISGNSEIANQIINLGASYENMKQKDEDIYKNFDISKVDIEKFNYNSIDTGNLTLQEYKQAVKENLLIALKELQQPKKTRVSNDIYLNDVIVFNTNTKSLSIKGQTISKQIKIKGEFKITKSAPKTVAKKLIEKQAKGKTQMLRRFKLSNIISNIKVKGETIEIS